MNKTIRLLGTFAIAAFIMASCGGGSGNKESSSCCTADTFTEYLAAKSPNPPDPEELDKAFKDLPYCCQEAINIYVPDMVMTCCPEAIMKKIYNMHK